MNNFASKEFWSIVVGGSALALNAGYINVVTLAGVFQVPVSHVTGNVSKMAIFMFQVDFPNFMLITSILFSFMFGSFIAGIMVGDNKFRLGKSYGYAVLLESFTLFLSFLLLKRELVVGEWSAAFACGLQNALATNYSGAVVRTTHMTGICTDIGNILGQACRRDSNAELWRLKVHVPILVSYLLGGIIGQAVYLGLHENALLLPSLFTACLGVLYLSLPSIQKARENLKEIKSIEKFIKLNGFEIRTTGDPRKLAADRDKLTVLVGKELELRQADVVEVGKEKDPYSERISIRTSRGNSDFNQFLTDGQETEVVLQPISEKNTI